MWLHRPMTTAQTMTRAKDGSFRLASFLYPVGKCRPIFMYLYRINHKHIEKMFSEIINQVRSGVIFSFLIQSNFFLQPLEFPPLLATIRTAVLRCLALASLFGPEGMSSSKYRL